MRIATSVLSIVTNRGGWRVTRPISPLNSSLSRQNKRFNIICSFTLIDITSYYQRMHDYCRKNPIVDFFYILLSNKTGDWPTDPGARVRACRNHTGCYANNPCLRYSNCYEWCGRETSWVTGKWGTGNRGENILNCWGPMTSADAPTKLYINVIRRRRLSYTIRIIPNFLARRSVTIDDNIMLSFVFYFR